jgi:hypothetical protein
MLRIAMQAGKHPAMRRGADIAVGTLRSTDEWRLYLGGGGFVAVFFTAIGADSAHLCFAHKRKELLA